MGLKRVDGGGSASNLAAPMTIAEVHRRMREIGARGNPDDPEYAQIRSAVIETISRNKPPGVPMDEERAAKIFEVFRRNPALIPTPPPTRPSTGYGSD